MSPALLAAGSALLDFRETPLLACAARAADNPVWTVAYEHGAGTADEQLSERARYLLHVLVESYIREGQPVGSRTLTRDSGLNLSSATVRNVMADLEEYGFVDLAAHLGRTRAHRQGLPVLRRYAAATRQRRRGGRRRRRAAPSPRAMSTAGCPRAGRRRVAGAVVDHAPGGRRHACRASRSSR